MLRNSILVIDDEFLALSYLVDSIIETKKEFKYLYDFEVLSTDSYAEFIDLLKENLPRVIFLDIQMPIKTGIEIAEEIAQKYVHFGYPEKDPPIIIFVTAYEQFGYKAFKVNAFDYILKPIDEEKLKLLFSKIERTNINIVQTKEEHISVQQYGTEINVPLKDIIYFEAEMKYIDIVTQKKKFIINDTLLNLEEKYPKFLKIHRAYLVNPFYVTKFFKKDNHWYVLLKGDIQLPVSRRQKQELEGKIDYNLFIENNS